MAIKKSAQAKVKAQTENLRVGEEVLAIDPAELLSDKEDNPSRWEGFEDLDVSDIMPDLLAGRPIYQPVIVADIEVGKGKTVRRLVAGRRRLKAVAEFNALQEAARVEREAYEAKLEKVKAKADAAAAAVEDAKEKRKARAEVLEKAGLAKAPAKPLPLLSVPARLAKDITNEADYVEVAGLENVTHKALTSADQAVLAFRLRETGKKQGDIAARLRKTQSHVSKLLTAYDLGKQDERFFALLAADKLSLDNVVKVAQAKLTPKQRGVVADMIEKGELSNARFSKVDLANPKGSAGASSRNGTSATAAKDYVLRSASDLDLLLQSPVFDDENGPYAHASGIVNDLRNFLRKTGETPQSIQDARKDLLHGIYMHSRRDGVRPGKLKDPVAAFVESEKALLKEGEARLALPAPESESEAETEEVA